MPGPFTYPVAESVYFDGPNGGMTSDDVQEGIYEANNQAQAAIYTITLVYNGSLSGTQFISYSNLTPNSPVIIPKDSFFVGFTYSSSVDTADYTINFRNNTNAGSPFYSISKTSTQFFAIELPTPQLFTAGSFISTQYVDDGTNGSDGIWALTFRAAP